MSEFLWHSSSHSKIVVSLVHFPCWQSELRHCLSSMHPSPSFKFVIKHISLIQVAGSKHPQPHASPVALFSHTACVVGVCFSIICVHAISKSSAIASFIAKRFVLLL